MFEEGQKLYKVEFFVDDEAKPYLRGGKHGPYLRIRISSGDNEFPLLNKKSYLESQIGTDALAGSSRFYLLHEADDNSLMVHNLFLKAGLKFDEFDTKNTYPLVLGPKGLLQESVRQAVARHLHDGVFVIGKGNKNNITKRRYEANPKVILNIVNRELSLAGIDNATDFSIFMSGAPEPGSIFEQKDTMHGIEQMNHPAILHRSSRPIVSTLDLTIGEMVKLDLETLSNAKKVRGLSMEDVQAFAKHLSRVSFLNSTQAKPNDPGFTHPEEKKSQNIPKRKPQRIKRFIEKIDPRKTEGRGFNN